MYGKFNRLKIEKQNKIINVALKNFAENGFENASTNTIAKEAAISKGSLFNYFSSKKGLYLYLFDYSLKTVEDLYENIDIGERDLFKRIGNLGIEKLNIFSKNPYLFDFLSSVKSEKSIDIGNPARERLVPLYEKGMEWIYEGIDYSNFREDVDIEKAIEILNWTMLGFGEKALKELDGSKDDGQFEKDILIKWEKYSNILKSNFYKKGES